MPGQDRRIPIGVTCILAGACTLTLFPQLPAGKYLIAVVSLALLLGIVRSLHMLVAFLAGFCVMWFTSAVVLQDRLHPMQAGQDIEVTGKVVDFPVSTADSVRFKFRPVGSERLPGLIRLAWYQPEYTPEIGEVWRLRVRLQRPRGLANPGGFDFAGWLFPQRIGATGFVIAGNDNRRRLSIQPDLVSRLRQKFVSRVATLLPNDAAAAVLMAIGVGARHEIAREDWDAYAITGTSHLMAISGLHIGLAAAAFYWLGWLLLAPFCRDVNVRDLAVCFALVAAGLYATVSGFAIPARRAILMLVLLSIAVVSRRQFSSAVVLAIAALFVFVIDPLSILTAGFKMSFAAVAVLLAGLRGYERRREIPGAWLAGHLLTNATRLLRLQVMLLCGLFPLSVFIFDRFALAAPAINMLVLPVFNFITVPFCLFGMLCDGPLQIAGDWFLKISYASIKVMLSLLERVATQPRLHLETAALSVPMIGVAILPISYVLLPRGWPGRRIAFLAMLSIAIYKPATPPEGCADYTVLDVGQGLATVVQTRSHTLVYDTGPLLRNGSDLGQLVVLPFIRDRGRRNIDKVIVSHADIDHAGGLQSLVSGLVVEELLVGEDIASNQGPIRHCQAGMTWTWDGVRFSVLHPQNRGAWAGNNISCILLIEVGTHRLLLTGDIEAPVETLLLHRGMLPPVSVVVVPHHGSGTSSGHALIRRLNADLAIVSAGYANRWGMPKGEVVRRWRQAGARLVNTATSGAISQRLCSNQPPGHVARYRVDVPRYWHDTETDGG